jgi:hypothetical protein
LINVCYHLMFLLCSMSMLLRLTTRPHIKTVTRLRWKISGYKHPIQIEIIRAATTNP